MIDPQLTNKNILITGGNNPEGIGSAAARAFACQGANVFIHYYRPVEVHPLLDSPQAGEESPQPGEGHYWSLQSYTPDKLVDEIRSQGGKAFACEADLSDPAILTCLFDQAEAALGPIEILVNNAALSDPDTFLPASELGEQARAVDAFPMHPISAEKIERHFAVNCQAAALLMAEFARRHIARQAKWGRIINITTDGSPGFASEVSYGASKYALESYSRAAAKELGRYGITVNILSLGPIQTGWINPDLAAWVARETPLGRPGVPAEVADVIVFLASEQARWVTGQLFSASGGMSMG